MTFTSDIDLKRIADGIRDLSLPKPDWTHTAHFAAAIWLLSEDGFDPFTEMAGTIRAYNEAAGVQNTDSEGYHETITQASLRAAAHTLTSAGPERALYQTANILMDGPYGRSDWLLNYWTRAVLFSAEARRDWVEPDVKPLPF
jgi:hypothetical protein